MKCLYNYGLHPSTQTKDKGWEGLGDLITLLGIVQQSLAGVPFQGVVAGPSELLRAFEAKHGNTVKFEELIFTISHLWEAVLVPLSDAKISGINVSHTVLSHTDRLRRQLDEILGNLKKYQTRSSFRQIFSNREITGALTDANSKLAAAINECLLAGSIWTQVQLGHMQDQTNHAMLGTLPHVPEAQYNSASRSFVSSCLEGTRELLLQQIYEWVMNPKAKPIFWLVGLAGTGKSTVAQTVAGHMDQQHILGGSFFFSRGEAARNNPFLVLPTLAYQLGHFDSSFGFQISQSLRAHSDAGNKSLHYQAQKLIIEPLCRASTRSGPVAIVIDALDEGAEGAEAILPLLAPWFSTFPFQFRILVTSRAEPKIRNNFSSSLMTSVSSLFELHEISESIVQNDIRHFLSHELAQVAEEILGSAVSWPSHQQLAELVQQARSLFIYAATAVKFIRDEQWSDPEHQLNVLLSGTSDSSTSPYHDIDRLYHHVLCDAITNTQDALLFARYQKVVGAIVLLQDPLPVTSLARLLDIKQNQIFSAVSKLHSVLIIPAHYKSSDKCIHILHPSFSEFVTDPLRCSDKHFLINKREHHKNLTEYCLKQMIDCLQEDICDIQDFSKLNSEVEDLSERIKEHLPPHLQYACIYWAYHLSQAATTDTGISAQLQKIWSEKLLHWLEALSLLNCLHTAIPSLKLAQQCCSMNLAFNKILHDAQRFVLEYFEPIASSAIHVYKSAIPFASDCMLYKTYQQQCQSSVRVVKGRTKLWHPCERVMEGHSHHVTSVAFSLDGTYIASGSLDKTIRLWNAITGVFLMSLEGNKSTIKAVAFSPDSKLIVSGLADDTIQIWDVETGISLKILKGHQSIVYSVKFSPDGTYIVSGADDHTVQLWDVTLGTQHTILNGHSGPVHSVVFSPDCAHIVSGSFDHTVRVWSAKNGALVKVLKGHTKAVTCVAVSSDNTSIVSSSGDQTIRHWDVITGKTLAILEGHKDIINSVAFSHDSAYLVSVSDDHTVRLWNINTSTSLAVLYGHSDWVRSVAFSPDSMHILSGSDDGTLRLWDAQMVSHSMTQADPILVTCVALSEQGRYVISGSDDSTIKLFGTENGFLLAIMKGHSKPLKSLAFSQDDTYIVSGSEDCIVGLWDLATGVQLKKLQGHSRTVVSVMFSSDNIYIISGSDDGTGRLWSVDDGTTLIVLEGHWNTVQSVAFSPDNTHVISGSHDHTVKVWDVLTGTNVATLTDHPDWVTFVTYSTDGSYIVCEDDNGNASGWATATHKYITSATSIASLSALISPSSVITTWLTPEGWIVNQQAGRLCWLPAAFRPRHGSYTSRFAVKGNYCVVLGNGTFIILDLSLVKK